MKRLVQFALSIPAILCAGLALASCSSSGDDGGSSTTITTIAASAGYQHSVAVRSDGSLWAWGDNTYGQLGNGVSTYIDTPAMMGNDRDWKTASCGAYHTVAIKTDGTLWAWGRNIYGQLGIGSTSNSSTPVQVGSDTWSTVSCGACFNAGIRSDGSLWTWGYNEYGQLGTDDNATFETSPQRVGTLATWSKISCGTSHALAIMNDGSLWSWGSDMTGQLGDGDGNVDDVSSPAQVGSSLNWATIEAGNYHSVALRQVVIGTRELWAWGRNNYGQLGYGTTDDLTSPTHIGSGTTWSSVAAGAYHSLGVLGGKLYAWGYDAYYQLGDGDSSYKTSAIQIGSDTDWSVVACGTYNSLAIKSNGSLWAWGWNDKGQVGAGGTDDVQSPTEIAFE